MTKIKVRKGIRSYQGMSDYIYLALTLFFLVACGLAVFLPLLYVVSASFSSPSAIGNGRVYLLPVDLSLAGYTAVVTSSRVWLGFRNSVIYTVLGTTLNIAMTMLAAYPLSRKDLKGRGVIMKLFTFTMLFGGGMIPNYGAMNTCARSARMERSLPAIKRLRCAATAACPIRRKRKCRWPRGIIGIMP